MKTTIEAALESLAHYLSRSKPHARFTVHGNAIPGWVIATADHPDDEPPFSIRHESLVSWHERATACRCEDDTGRLDFFERMVSTAPPEVLRQEGF